MGMDHPLFLLAIVTFVIVLAIAAWSLLSVKRRQKYGRSVQGIGGDNDPMA
jgi:ribose/xylose/arabinose/galactoside ABC-type transport system permease subunit